MEILKKIKDVFPDITQPYFFKHLAEKLQWPEINPHDTALAYFSHSREKYISPLLENVEDMEKLADIILLYYKHSWTRLHDLTNMSYNPIENYNSDETQTTEYGKKTTHGKGTTVTTSPVTDEESNSYTYGYNSSVATPEGKVTTKPSTTEVSGTGEDTDTDSGKDTIKIKKAGNIGVTTSQQMAQAEIELWQWNFTQQVIEDLDKILTLTIY